MHLTVSVMSHGSHPPPRGLLSPDPAAVGPERLRARGADRRARAAGCRPARPGVRRRPPAVLRRGGPRAAGRAAGHGVADRADRADRARRRTPLHHAEPYNVARSFATPGPALRRPQRLDCAGLRRRRPGGRLQPSRPRRARHAEDSDRAIELIDVAPRTLGQLGGCGAAARQGHGPVRRPGPGASPRPCRAVFTVRRAAERAAADPGAAGGDPDRHGGRNGPPGRGVLGGCGPVPRRVAGGGAVPLRRDEAPRGVVAAPRAGGLAGDDGDHADPRRHGSGGAAPRG